MAQSNSTHFPDRHHELELRCHAMNRCDAVSAVKVSVRIDVALQVQFHVFGQIDSLNIPVLRRADRTDELWRHTCAEVFLANPNHSRYCEFNFSPSSQWAAYEFTGYREGMRALSCDPPVISVSGDSREMILDINVMLPPDFNLPHMRLGASMVIEDHHQQCSYWALQHDTDKPDFHRRENWLCVL